MIAKRILTMILSIVLTSVAVAQKSQKEILKETQRNERDSISRIMAYAQSIAIAKAMVFDVEPLKILIKFNNIKDIENYATITYISDFYGLDAAIRENEVFGITHLVKFRVSRKLIPLQSYGPRTYLIHAGECTMMAPRNGAIVERKESRTEKSIFYLIDSLTFNFEAGKHYTIASCVDKEDKVEFSIKETDTTAYLAYMDEHPSGLDGTWQGEVKNFMNPCFVNYTFWGNKLTVDVKPTKKTLFKQSFFAEGRFIYSANTIIFLPHTVRFKDKEFEFPAAYVWHYTIRDNLLTLQEGSPFVYNLNSNGVFTRM